MPSPFPAPFQSFKPRWQQVRGCICISKDNRILLVKGRQHNLWSFPKGHFKGNETSHECALRELYEETGISLSTSSPYIGTKKLSIGEYFIYEMDEKTQTSIQDSFEVCDIGWFSLEEIHNLQVNRDVNCFSNLLVASSSTPNSPLQSPREVTLDVM